LRCRRCGKCVEVCPGIEISHQVFDDQVIPELCQEWGPVLEIWEGYAADPEIRYAGSSGGVATALSLFCLEKENMSAVLHIGTRSGVPLENTAVFSKGKSELLARTGSRYSPAAPCEKLNCIAELYRSCVFIGKPCDIVGLRKSQVVNPILNERVSLAISIFCAGTPPTKGTLDILRVLGVSPEEVAEIRYRGEGWPGMTTVKVNRGNNSTRQISYEDSWGNILSKYRQFRCVLCPDSTGEFADISCGDPWYRAIKPGEIGRSLILVRTEKGRDVLQRARAEAYVKLERVEPSVLPCSQEALLQRRRCLWGRLLAMRMTRVPVPSYKGFFLWRNWLRLPMRDKLRSFGGTLKRIALRGWTSPLRPIIKDNRLQNAING
jgi:coenzyme F420 hydrogenase subunit beta